MHGLIEILKGRILKRIITWSEMGQQTAQSKKVYCLDHNSLQVFFYNQKVNHNFFTLHLTRESRL